MHLTHSLEILVVLLVSFCNLSHAGLQKFQTSLEKETVRMLCPSKEPPIWEKYTKTDNVNLAVGTKKRTAFDDER